MLAVSAAHTVYAQDFQLCSPTASVILLYVSDVNAVIAKRSVRPELLVSTHKAAADAALDQPLIQYIDTGRNRLFQDCVRKEQN